MTSDNGKESSVAVPPVAAWAELDTPRLKARADEHEQEIMRAQNTGAFPYNP